MSTATIHIKTDKQLVPELRFKEFDKSWNLSEVNEECKIYDGTHQTPKYVEEGVPFYSVEHVSSNNFEKTKFISEEVFQKECKRVTLTKGDVLMTRIGDVGTPKLIDWDVRASFYVSLALFKITSANLNSKFLACSIESIPFQKEIWKRMIHVAFPKKINLGEIGNCKFNLPSLREQQKIASFLSAVDEKIQQLTKKKALLEQYKKGVMQQLFSGQLRFKDENGNPYPDWEEKRLSKFLKYYDGTHQTPKYVEKGVPFYSVEHVTANQFSKTKFITEEVFEKENKRVMLEKGDILMTRIGDIGTARLIDWDVRASFYVSLALLKQNPSFDSTYLNQYISSVPFQKELWAKTIHVAFPKKINLGEIGNCKAQLPCIEEQQKIATYLSNIDTKIEAVNSQITQTQTFKKGLLQQMFV